MVTIQIYSSGMTDTISSVDWPLGFGIRTTYKCEGNHTYWGIKHNWGMQSKMVIKICEGISCSSSYVKEFDVIVHKKKAFSLYNPIKFLVILYPKSRANLVVEVGTRHSHQVIVHQWFSVAYNPHPTPIHSTVLTVVSWTVVDIYLAIIDILLCEHFIDEQFQQRTTLWILSRSGECKCISDRG